MPSAILEDSLGWITSEGGNATLEATTERHREESHTVEVLECAKAGSREAFNELVGLYQERIFNYVNKMAGNAQDAEDITQETFIKVYKNLRRHKSDHPFSPWLFTIAKRTALNYFRKRKPTSEFVDYYQADTQDPSVQLAKKERSQSFWRITERLKPIQREILWLRYGEDFSIEEIARIVRKNQIYVRVALHRARNQLAGYLNAFNETMA